jgi:choline-sulfatase
VGILSNQLGLSDARLPCEPLPELLRKAGYQTAGFGKTHWSWKGCSTRGFEVRYASTDPEQGAVLMSADNPEGLRRYSQETKSCGAGGENNVGYLGFTSKLAETDHRDGWALARCLEFLDHGRDPKRPLFLYFSCLAPHAPHNVPPGYEDLYDLRTMPVPEQPPKELVEPCHATGTNRETMYRPFWSHATREQWQQMVLRYRANCSWVDSLFGRIVMSLRTKGLLDNCLIVYVSDHGEMLGERYYRFNKYCLYEHSVRVPLILAGTAVPKERKGTIDHRPAEEVDILPTILQVAGIRGARDKLGQSLLEHGSRKASFCEFNDQARTISFMWRTSDRKLILTFSKECLGTRSIRQADIETGEFYDLKADPKEWHNLYSQEAARAERDRMSAELIAHLNRAGVRKAAVSQ